MESNLKPIICWNCMYLASCINYSEKGCDKFESYTVTLQQIADLIKISYGKLRYLEKKKGKEYTVKYINKIAKPLKFRCEKVEGRCVYERVK